MATRRTWQWRLVDDVIAEADADEPGRFVYWHEEGIEGEGVLWRCDLEREEPQEVRPFQHREREANKAKVGKRHSKPPAQWKGQGRRFNRRSMRKRPSTQSTPP